MATGNKKACNAQYWAVGYTNGGANETRLGPFTEQSDAIKAGMVEQGKTRGFTLSGVVDESGKYVYSNAKACNAKFKVGDKVKFWVFDKKADGTVKKVVGEKVTVDDGKGNEVEFPAKDLEVWNAGDGRVKGYFVWFSPRSGLAAKTADDIVRKVSGAKTRGANIIEVGDEASAQKVYDLFRKAKVPAKDLNVGYNSCAASTNSVVANAMAANGKGAVANSWRDDPNTKRAYARMKEALRYAEMARQDIGQAEEDEDAIFEAGRIDEAIKHIKDAIRAMD